MAPLFLCFRFFLYFNTLYRPGRAGRDAGRDLTPVTLVATDNFTGFLIPDDGPVGANHDAHPAADASLFIEEYSPGSRFPR
jgi:hypothetical protein